MSEFIQLTLSFCSGFCIATATFLYLSKLNDYERTKKNP